MIRLIPLLASGLDSYHMGLYLLKGQRTFIEKQNIFMSN